MVLRTDEIKPVIYTRNELVHRTMFRTKDEEWEEFVQTLSLLDRLLMGLLEYRGPSVDPRTMTRVDPSIQYGGGD